jgi:hypothetical protein
MRKNIIHAVIITILAALACWRLSRLAPLPSAPDSDLVAFGGDARNIARIAEPTAAKAIVYDANKEEPEEQKILIPPGAWIVPEQAIHIADRKESDVQKNQRK